jgi:hypothetical protein
MMPLNITRVDHGGNPERTYYGTHETGAVASACSQNAITMVLSGIQAGVQRHREVAI